MSEAALLKKTVKFMKEFNVVASFSEFCCVSLYHGVVFIQHLFASISNDLKVKIWNMGVASLPQI